MFCRNCGQSIANDATSCPNCGQVIFASQQPQPPPEQPAAQPPPPSPVQPAAGGMPAYYAAPPPMAQPAPVYAQPYYAQVPPPARPKKHHGCLIAFLVAFVLFLAAGAAVYFLLPGLFKPRDLGIVSSQKAYESALEKMNFTKDEAPGSGLQKDYKYVYGPLVPVQFSLSNEEISSFFNINRPPYFPVTKVQVKVGTKPVIWYDGGVIASLSTNPVSASSDPPIEVSAEIDRDYALLNLLGDTYSLTEIQNMVEEIGISKLLPSKVNLYIKMSGSIQNNKVVSLKLYAASLMGVSIPSEYVTSSDAENIVKAVIEKLLADYQASSGAVFISIRAENGEILLQGQLPSSLSRSRVSK